MFCFIRLGWIQWIGGLEGGSDLGEPHLWSAPWTWLAVSQTLAKTLSILGNIRTPNPTIILAVKRPVQILTCASGKGRQWREKCKQEGQPTRGKGEGEMVKCALNPNPNYNYCPKSNILPNPKRQREGHKKRGKGERGRAMKEWQSGKCCRMYEYENWNGKVQVNLF